MLGLGLMHHRTTRGGPLTFKDKPYLIELYKDFPNIDGADGMKAVQVGWSELLIQLVLERAGWSGRIAAYVLPTYQLRDRFVQARVDPLLQTVPIYRDRLHEGSHGSLRIKRFGSGNLMFLGSNTPNDFIEFSADVLIVDEFDRCEQQNLALARDRLRASPYPQMFRIGNPTMPNMGVHRLFSESDGRRWHFRWSPCGEMQPVDWFVNVVRRDENSRWVFRDPAAKPSSHRRARPVCRRCSKPFEREAEGGCWVAERTSVYRRGYHMTRMDVISQPLESLYQEWLEAQGVTARLRAFYASVLGVPYEEAGSTVTAEVLTRLCIGDPIEYGGGDKYRQRVVVAGIDVGTLLNVNVSVLEHDDYGNRVRRCVYLGALTEFSQVYHVLDRFHVDCAVIDARPETRKAQELRDRCMQLGKASVWLAQFHPTDRIGRQDYGMRLDHARHVVTVDRTQLLDATVDEMRHDPPKRVFPSDSFTVEGWADQMQASRRVLNERGDRFVWRQGSQADHYRFSDAYERIASDLVGTSAEYYTVDS